ncbi:hypothetical protein GO495_16495 [Chitinophaga oryziterrae]|uniref:Uncharacterized protein n=1 Tax=Chitinophaga oryziterrae TaxID=1031224 RepID=A0A6N8JDK0_9BACT|nr:hypothetical protein [Chitinophaga oryziterrae]MVT42192.1 hypothetical protein [Chitinophaga oryziterrae]
MNGLCSYSYIEMIKRVFVAVAAGYIYSEVEGIARDFVRLLLKAVR